MDWECDDGQLVIDPGLEHSPCESHLVAIAGQFVLDWVQTTLHEQTNLLID